MTAERDDPLITPDWFYVLIRLIVWIFVFAVCMGVTSYFVFTNHYGIRAVVVQLRDFIEAMSWTSPFLFY